MLTGKRRGRGRFKMGSRFLASLLTEAAAVGSASHSGGKYLGLFVNLEAWPRPGLRRRGRVASELLVRLSRKEPRHMVHFVLPHGGRIPVWCPGTQQPGASGFTGAGLLLPSLASVRLH